MKSKKKKSPARNLNPLLSVANDCTVLYSNKAGEPLLHEWSVKVGEKVPSNIGEIVKRIISLDSPEKLEIKVGNRIYLVIFSPIPEKECISISGFDISDQKGLIRFTEKAHEREAKKVSKIEFAEIIDTQAIQSLMNDFYKLTRIPIGIIDINGNVLVGVGWQDICTKFHRVHPEACKHCIESDTKLSLGVSRGEFKLYKCKNNMWDVATPIIVEGQHVANIFLGQFFFEDENLDYELFRAQARKYSFNEEEYIAALEKVPRLSREAVNQNMSFFMKLANMLSQLSHSNFKLSQALADRDSLLKALQESERREQTRSGELEALLDAVPVAVFISHDPNVLQISGNRLSYEWINAPMGTNFSKSAPEGERPVMFKLFKDGIEIPPEEMPSQLSAKGIEINDYEVDIVSTDNKIRHVLGNARPLRDEQGNLRGSISAFIDITKRKKAEIKLEETLENLENLVGERTSKLQKAYNLLKESEKGLAEAQRMAHIGNWDWNLVTGEVHWSNELYRIFGCSPQKPGATLDEFLNYVYPDDRDRVHNAIKKGLDGELITGNYRIILASGEERIVHTEAEVFYNDENNPIQVKGTVQDITEIRKVEEQIKILANIVESSNDAIGTISLDGKITSWNQEAENIYGYSLKEVLGKRLSN